MKHFTPTSPTKYCFCSKCFMHICLKYQKGLHILPDKMELMGPIECKRAITLQSQCEDGSQFSEKLRQCKPKNPKCLLSQNVTTTFSLMSLQFSPFVSKVTPWKNGRVYIILQISQSNRNIFTWIVRRPLNAVSDRKKIKTLFALQVLRTENYCCITAF